MKRLMSLFLSVLLLVNLLAVSAMAEPELTEEPETTMEETVQTEQGEEPAQQPEEEAGGESVTEPEPEPEERDPNRMYISEEGIAFICGFEGYRQFAYPDGGKWYIGYGTLCEKDQYPDGVTQEEAVTIMLAHMESMEDKLNNFLTKYEIKLNQQQYDALMSLTYNVGTTWINPAYRLCQYLMSDMESHTQDEVVNYIGTWCHVGKDVVHGLAVRRVREAYLFLYGDYGNKGDENYAYVHYEVGDGEIDHSTVFYPVNKTYDKLPVPIRPGKYFQGWYMDNGVMLTGDDIAVNRLTVEAKWGERPVEDTGIFSTPWDNPFSDLREGEWYYAYVKNLTRVGKINGYPDGTFKPINEITVGEALKLILLTAGYEEQPMTDEHWASGYRDLALSKGFISEADTKDLDKAMSRYLIAQLAALALELPESDTQTPFTDTDNGYVLALYDAGIVTGSYLPDGSLVYLGDSGIIRSELCALVWRMYQYVPPLPDQPEEPEEVEEPEDEPTPEELGYIEYSDKKLPILEDVPKCEYDRSKFVYEDGILTYNDKKVDTWMGIDVSNYQGDVDWKQVADAGVDFAMVRAGFRGYTAGGMNEDASFEKNVTGASEAGLKVGVYFFSTAISEEEALEEAEFVLDLIDGYDIDYPVVYDWESNSKAYRNYNLDTETLTSAAIAFCERVAEEGYDPMVYFNLPTGYLKYDLSELTDYDFWFAQYPKEDAMYPTMYYNYQMWQYSDSGSIPGIDGKVDMNIAWKTW